MKISLNNAYTKYVETGLRPVSAIIIRVSALILFVSLISCADNHLINNSKYLADIDRAFALKKELAANRDSSLFSVFKQDLSMQQSDALKFLYAYMPLSDLADYNGDFFLSNVNFSIKSRKETTWGKNIPEDIFLHYVLPFRINNENLDSFRILYYDELTQRIKGKDLSEAALEINHWCHEKVSYQAADMRTSGPLSTILSSRGRCGEESTLTVSALRTVGIPARQVYTPRWAHTDDNHAWVEIWNNGKWYYMGACEPEPVLDLGWFTEPARRAMLVHTKSFGAFSGDENAINKSSDFTDVNNLAKYAATKRIFVKVTDKNGKPVSNAKVEYQLYNYAEFYPLAVVPTNDLGISQFETGLGDLLIWAHKDDDFDFKKISVGETDTLQLKLSNELTRNNSLDLDLDVPIVRSPLAGPSNDLVDQNSKRIINENSIRQKYIDSWMKSSDAKAFAIKLKTDTLRVMNAISRSMGNYKEITSFLSQTPDSLLTYALSMLEILPDKDLRDVRSSTFSDHLRYCVNRKMANPDMNNDFLIANVLNPRIANEILVPWRHYFQTRLPSGLKSDASANPSIVVRFLNENIRIAEDENYYGTPITPIGVCELKVSDAGSRAICFVAICRSLGIPSRLEPGRNVPQYFFDKEWIDVYFSDQTPPDQNKGYIRFHSEETKPVPEYYIQFTLARFENGRYNTLEYDFNKKISEFKDELPLPPGHYMLVTGNRLSDSKILTNLSFFDLAENEHKTIDVKIRKDLSERKILGNIDIKKVSSLYPLSSTSQACSNEKGTVIFWIEPEKEPAKHILNDLPFLKAEFDKWGGKFLFLSVTGSGNDLAQQLVSVKGLPVNTFAGIDENMMVLKNFVRLNQPSDLNLPVTIVADKDGNILFLSTGYRIGIGEQILKYMK
jgi:transglutaminase-like putative cysteine protease